MSLHVFIRYSDENNLQVCSWGGTLVGVWEDLPAAVVGACARLAMKLVWKDVASVWLALAGTGARIVWRGGPALVSVLPKCPALPWLGPRVDGLGGRDRGVHAVALPWVGGRACHEVGSAGAGCSLAGRLVLTDLRDCS